MLRFVKKWKWFIAGGLVVIVIGVSIYFFFFRTTPTTTRYLTTPITMGSITQSVSATGSITSSQQKNYGFKIGGILAEANVKIGDQVKAGQQMAKLDTSTLQTQLAQSQSALKVAQNNFNNRFKSAPNNYDTANLQESVNTAQAKLNTDLASLDNTVLKSPVSGKISKVNNNVGDSVSSSNTVFVITDGDGNGNNTKNITFATPGRIVEIDKNVGDGVNVGDVLAKLDNTQAKNQVVQSQSSLRVAQNNYNNRNKSTSNSFDTDNLQQTIAQAQAKVDSDKQNLDAAVLKSDKDGVVSQFNYSVGDTVSAGGTSSGTATTSTGNSGSGSSVGASGSVVTVVDMSTLVASLTFPESDIIKLKVGQSTQLILDVLGTKTFTGKVQSIDTVGTVSSNVVSYGVKISFDKLDSAIKPAMTVTGSIITGNKDNVLVVPSISVRTASGQKSIQILNQSSSQSGQVEIRSIKVGVSNDTQTEIISGVSEGELAVTGVQVTGGSNRSVGNTSSGGSLFNLNPAGGAGGGNNNANRNRGGG